MAKPRLKDDEDILDDVDPLEEEKVFVEDSDEDPLLEEGETLEELEVDDRGHVRPRRRHEDEEEDEY